MSDTIRRGIRIRYDEEPGAVRPAADRRPRLTGRLSMRAFWGAVDPDREPDDQPSAPIRR